MKSCAVLKFGGTSVGSPERIRACAEIIANYKKKFDRVVVVVSAMGHTTDELISLALQVSPHAQKAFNRREMDMLLSSGERISMALTSLALSDLGVGAVSFTGSQSGIITDRVHGEAKISDIRPTRIVEELERNKVVIVAGFQGVSAQKEITTLGRGGSDTSAVALAAVLKADKAVIFTDVDGFYSADPRRVPDARRYKKVGWDLALACAHYGAQVFHPRCVELAWKHALPVELASSFKSEPGTLMEGVTSMLEGAKVLSVALSSNLTRAEMAASTEPAKLLESLREHGVKVSGWKWAQGRVSFYVAREEAERLKSLPQASAAQLLPTSRLALVGPGLHDASAIHEKLWKLFANAGAKIVEWDSQPLSLAISFADFAGTEDLYRLVHKETVV